MLSVVLGSLVVVVPGRVVGPSLSVDVVGRSLGVVAVVSVLSSVRDDSVLRLGPASSVDTGSSEGGEGSSEEDGEGEGGGVDGGEGSSIDGSALELGFESGSLGGGEVVGPGFGVGLLVVVVVVVNAGCSPLVVVSVGRGRLLLVVVVVVSSVVGAAVEVGLVVEGVSGVVPLLVAWRLTNSTNRWASAARSGWIPHRAGNTPCVKSFAFSYCSSRTASLGFERAAWPSTQFGPASTTAGDNIKRANARIDPARIMVPTEASKGC